jgi:hypothetical protein
VAPEELDVGDEGGHEDNVRVALANHLVGDAGVAALGVLRFGAMRAQA